MPRPPVAVLLLNLAAISLVGCSTGSDKAATFTVLGDDTVLVDGGRDAINLALTDAAFLIGATEPVPGSDATRLPSYQDRSEFRSIQENGSAGVFEQRTLRFQTPDGVWIEALILYNDDSTTVRVTTDPVSQAAQRAYTQELARILRERGVSPWP